MLSSVTIEKDGVTTKVSADRIVESRSADSIVESESVQKEIAKIREYFRNNLSKESGVK